MRRRNYFTPKGKYYSKDAARAAIMRFCAYQERCHQEVRGKLRDLGIYGDTVDELILELIEEDILNEERFARAFARGKFRLKQYGRRRIDRELRQRDISDYCRKKALEELEEYDYYGTLLELTERKNTYLQEPNPWNRRRKLTDMLLRRGYESDLIKRAIVEVCGEITSDGRMR